MSAPSLAITLLGELHGVPDGDHVHCVCDFTVGELRSLCAVVLRLQAYLDWADKQAELQWEHPLDEHPRGYVEAHRDVRAFVLGGKLERMLRGLGDEKLAGELEELLGVEP